MPLEILKKIMSYYKKRIFIDNVSHKIIKIIALIGVLVFFVIFYGIIFKSLPILKNIDLNVIFFSNQWNPPLNKFGLLGFIVNTFLIAILAVIIALPISLLTAIYLAEYSSRKSLDGIRSLIDLLASIPSVIYGVWGVLVIVPFVKNYFAPFCGADSSGYSLISASIVLAIMISPIIIQITLELLLNLPRELKESALALGITKWQSIKKVLLKKISPGILAAVILATVRALGETMAVMMLAGNVNQMPDSLFSPVYSLSALIANTYGELFSIPLYESAVFLSVFILLLVIVFFNIAANFVLLRLKRNIQ